MRSRTRRRSTSSCVSPGPRVPTPPPQARQVGPGARQPWQQVLELRQLDLQLALEAARALREDVEDQRAAVDDLAAERLLEVALLCGRERVVEDDDVGGRRSSERLHLLDLAAADEGRRMDAAQRLDGLADHGDAGRVREPLQLERGSRDRDEGTRRVDGHEDGALRRTRAVLCMRSLNGRTSLRRPALPPRRRRTSSLAATRMVFGQGDDGLRGRRGARGAGTPRTGRDDPARIAFRRSRWSRPDGSEGHAARGPA